ncbi:MAG TPA: aminotransferase class III-fold pyridoxal phosphate-dependent enzyme, partial [Candidatus Caldiarchaeum subterraneum]|nr:aminotransferase class III-fold pyridoxal phosphate-dependent enzyme [Candidatus Caldarchaeum subterraneum]
RKKIIMFEGCYHGHVDYLLTKAGSGLATYSIPKSAGIPEEAVMHTITLSYNKPEEVREAFKKHGGEIAAVIVEPIAGNMGVVKPKKEFIQVLREETEKHDSLLIFDEVITGFRVAYGGAQHLYSITPDLTCLGKVIGGGLPIGAVGGRGDVMDKLSPLGSVYQAGTFSGNPLSMTAGLATLQQLSPQTYEKLEEISKLLEEKTITTLREYGINVAANRVGSMMTFFFTKDESVQDYSDVQRCDRSLFAKFFRSMMSRGVLLPPSQFESIFLTLTHSRDVIHEVVEAVKETAEEIGGDSHE